MSTKWGKVQGESTCGGPGVRPVACGEKSTSVGPEIPVSLRMASRCGKPGARVGWTSHGRTPRLSSSAAEPP